MNSTLDTKDLWRQILLRLYPTIRHDQFITWFPDTAILRVDNGMLVLGVPTQFAYSWISQHYQGRILEIAKVLEPSVLDISVVVDPGLLNPEDIRKVLLDSIVPEVKKVRK